jgi:superfamily I DNA and/or RNA helicase
LEKFEDILINKKAILKEIILIKQLPISVQDVLHKFESIAEINGQIYWSVWKKYFPNLDVPFEKTLKDWIRASLHFEKNKKQDFKSNSVKIIRSIKQKFDSYHQLIETPNRKLSQEEQILKNELKVGKKILVKEFGKTKQHIGLRKLYESEAKKWLEVLKPILMMHPLRIATYFPPEPGLFDLGIIDEASQMPFKNSIGTLQRVKRILIAGDENQMNPSIFFSSNDDDHSVYHQAKYHLKNIELKHHYRSESEELIAFSNRYFYENKLRFIEKANFPQKQSVMHHFIEKGNYRDGVNEHEAQNVSNFIIEQIGKITDEISIGIVAFSEIQLKTIAQKIPSQYETIIEELEESNRIFFKTLDQVQGDECDILIISFGYGKNEEGRFEMRFGPVNQSGGEKRLNVLFSRAKKEIHFFSSVKFNDFPPTKNDAVQLLKNWFALLEVKESKKMKSYKIHLLNILEKSKNSDDFTHLINQYYNRGWEILTT